MAANKDSTKEIKSTLKNAREAIRNKEYKDALKYCKVKTFVSFFTCLQCDSLKHFIYEEMKSS